MAKPAFFASSFFAAQSRWREAGPWQAWQPTPRLCQRLEKKHGARFAPPKLLVEMARNGDSFYRRFAPGKKAA